MPTQDADALGFTALEKRLKGYLAALWAQHPILRSAAAHGVPIQRRVSFGDGVIRVPERFPGVPPRTMPDLLRAALAHVGAHLRFGRGKFPFGSLKPLQVALVSLIEDARVEQLALHELPGLRRLWVPFHVAEPGGLAASVLLARLARALLDPQYGDPDEWVQKGHRLFYAEASRWDDPSISRAVGGLLGNDLGQMRVQFNARDYVVEPLYRDDNLGLWDFPPAAQPEAEAELAFEPVRLDQVESDLPPGERERERPNRDDRPGAAKMAKVGEVETVIPVACHPEWDYAIGRDRPNWVTVAEVAGRAGRPGSVEAILERHAGLVERLTALIRSAKVSRPVRLRRQPEGDGLDLDACVAATISRRRGEVPDPGVYTATIRRHRDLSSLVLLDISESTNDIVRAAGASVLTLEREAAALLGHAMEGLGDSFAIRAFCSNGRQEVRYHRVKDFDEPFAQAAKLRLAGLVGSLSTRIGAAIRHAGAELERQRMHRRLLLVVTDGEPSDVDVGERRYLVEDARKAVFALVGRGIDVFCVALDSGGDRYLSRIFGRHNVVQIDRVERLPEQLPTLYLRLIG